MMLSSDSGRVVARLTVFERFPALLISSNASLFNLDRGELIRQHPFPAHFPLKSPQSRSPLVFTKRP